MTTITKGKKEATRLLREVATDGEQSPQQLLFSVNYMSFFGYVANGLLKNMNRKDLSKAVEKFQSWFGLVTDGIVGPKTLRAMEVPRCGCPDIEDKESDVNLQFMRMQAITQENKHQWTKHGLTYAVAGYVGGISKTRQLKIFAAAFKSWADICGLEIRVIRDASKADLVISTGEGRRHRFDGRGGTLGWAYLPNGQGKRLQMRFDLAETWTYKPTDRGILLPNVAGHEFGHLLGLTHSKKKTALMAPFYNPHIAVPQRVDDVSRMTAKYGKNKAAVPPPVPIAKDGMFHLHCSDLKIDGYELVRKK
jgi:hypothetical protein